VPVENLPVTRGQVNITNHITVNDDISFTHSITYTMHSDQGYITGETMPIGCRVMASCQWPRLGLYVQDGPASE